MATSSKATVPAATTTTVTKSGPEPGKSTTSAGGYGACSPRRYRPAAEKNDPSRASPQAQSYATCTGESEMFGTLYSDNSKDDDDAEAVNPKHVVVKTTSKPTSTTDPTSKPTTTTDPTSKPTTTTDPKSAVTATPATTGPAATAAAAAAPVVGQANTAPTATSQPAGSTSSGTGSGAGVPTAEAKVKETYTKCTVIGVEFVMPSRYVPEKLLGKGAYGAVIRCTDKLTRRTVAVKKVSGLLDDLIDAKRVLREVVIMRTCRHPKLTHLIDLFSPAQHGQTKVGPNNFNAIYLVYDAMDIDLSKAIEGNRRTLGDEHVQYFMTQILQGLQYLHRNNILHRDLKPSNLLVNTDCELRITDFGLSRRLPRKQSSGTPPATPAGGLCSPFSFASSPPASKLPSPTTTVTTTEAKRSSPTDTGVSGSAFESAERGTEYVVTRWYRAPELLVEASKYGSAIDVWAAGCIMAEILLPVATNGGSMGALFRGSDSRNQLLKIISSIGAPSPATMESMGASRLAQQWMAGRNERGTKWTSMFTHASADALDLLSKMLVFDPDKRITVDQALEHKYLQKFRHDSSTGNSAKDDEDAWAFERETSLSENQLRVLFWKEIVRFRPDRQAELDEWLNRKSPPSASAAAAK